MRSNFELLLMTIVYIQKNTIKAEISTLESSEGKHSEKDEITNSTFIMKEFPSFYNKHFTLLFICY